MLVPRLLLLALGVICSARARWKNEQMVEQNDERRFKAKNCRRFKESVHKNTRSGGKR